MATLELDKATPKRGEVINLQTGVSIIADCSRDPKLASFFEKSAGFLKSNDQFFVMYRRQVFKEADSKELLTSGN